MGENLKKLDGTVMSNAFQIRQSIHLLL